MSLWTFSSCADRGGVLLWADRQCADVSALVEERGVPSARPPSGWPPGTYSVRTDRAPQTGSAFSSTARISTWVLSATTRSPGACAPWIWAPPPSSSALDLSSGRDVTYTVALPNNGEPYAITLDLEHQITLAVFAGRVLLICQLVSLLCNLFKNAGTIQAHPQTPFRSWPLRARLGNASSSLRRSSPLWREGWMRSTPPT